MLEVAIVSCFDSLDRRELQKRLERRVADGALLRLIGKCLHVGGSTAKRVLSQKGVPPKGQGSPHCWGTSTGTLYSTSGSKPRCSHGFRAKRP